jgi:hypothetical protein
MNLDTVRETALRGAVLRDVERQAWPEDLRGYALALLLADLGLSEAASAIPPPADAIDVPMLRLESAEEEGEPEPAAEIPERQPEEAEESVRTPATSAPAHRGRPQTDWTPEENAAWAYYRDRRCANERVEGARVQDLLKADYAGVTRFLGKAARRFRQEPERTPAEQPRAEPEPAAAAPQVQKTGPTEEQIEGRKYILECRRAGRSVSINHLASLLGCSDGEAQAFAARMDGRPDAGLAGLMAKNGAG